LKAVVRWKDGAGKWHREFFRSAGEAKTFAQQRETELLNQGRDVLNFPAWLRVMAQECQASLGKFGKTLRDATAHYLAHLQQQSASCTVAVAFAEYHAKKKAAGVTIEHLRHLNSLLGRNFPAVCLTKSW
jgi:hypothetical protein